MTAFNLQKLLADNGWELRVSGKGGVFTVRVESRAGLHACASGKDLVSVIITATGNAELSSGD